MNDIFKLCGKSIVLAALLGLPIGCDKAAGDKAAKPAASGEKKHAHEHAPGGDEKAGGDHHDHAHGEHVDEVKLTAEAIKANHVRIAKAEKKVLKTSITAPARVAFNTEHVAHVGSILKGRVAELKVRLGATVERGAPLLVIDSTELGEAQSDYLQRKLAAGIATSGIELVKSGFDRAQQLYDKNQGISLTELQKRQAEFQMAQGASGAADAALIAAESRLQLLGMKPEEIKKLAETKQLNPKYTIVAPIDGQVVQWDATIGELVSPDKEHLLTIADLKTLWVFADVPEAQLAEITDDAVAKVSVAALQGDPIEGKVEHILPQLDETTRTARVRISVKNDKLSLRPGMWASAEIITGATEGVVVIPEAAVQNVEGEPAIFVPHEKEANTFLKRQVGVGLPVDGVVPVFAGLKEGEPFVAGGAFVLKAEIGKEGAAHEH
jgi:cobalt-zinc-cadmium efflux system membrane fusion protein